MIEKSLEMLEDRKNNNIIKQCIYLFKVHNVIKKKNTVSTLHT